MKKTGLRILAWILAVLMTVQVAPVEVRAEEAEESQAAEVSGERSRRKWPQEKRGSRVLGEVTENREEEEKHFRMEDGSFVGVNYGVPVHYAQGEEWKDIDNTLVIQENGMRTAAQEEGTEAPRYVAVNGEESRGFAGNLGSGFLFSANTGEEGMEFSLVSPEEEETVPATEAETIPETEAATEGAIIPETEAATEVATIPEREAATEGATDPETEGATEAATIPETEAATEGATAPETATEAATVPETEGVEPGVLPEAETAWEAAEQEALTEEPVGEREEVATEPETDPVTGLEEAQEATETAQGEARRKRYRKPLRPPRKLQSRRRRNPSRTITGRRWLRFLTRIGRKRLPLVLLVWLPRCRICSGRGRRGGRVSEPADYPPPVFGPRWCMRRSTPVWTSSMSCTATTSRRPFW